MDEIINYNSNVTNRFSYAFFGSGDFSVIVLEKMKSLGFMPNLIVTIEDQPRGRKMILTPEEVRVWAEKESIPFLQLKTLKKEGSFNSINDYFPNGADVFVVTHYGKMIPDNILNFPKHKTLNIHPSLLPKLRGASPIKSAILNEIETGVTIIELDSEMDHGPILSQKKIETLTWPPYEEDLKKDLANLGGDMISEILPKWINGEIETHAQNHEKATFCRKIEKKDGEIDLLDSPEINIRKIRAYHSWPTAFFFDNEKRVIIKKAHLADEKLVIESVVPEGKIEMSYEDYLRGKKI